MERVDSFLACNWYSGILFVSFKTDELNAIWCFFVALPSVMCQRDEKNRKISIPDETQSVVYDSNKNEKNIRSLCWGGNFSEDQKIVALVYFTPSQTCRCQLN